MCLGTISKKWGKELGTASKEVVLGEHVELCCLELELTTCQSWFRFVFTLTRHRSPYGCGSEYGETQPQGFVTSQWKDRDFLANHPAIVSSFSQKVRFIDSCSSNINVRVIVLNILREASFINFTKVAILSSNVHVQKNVLNILLYQWFRTEDIFTRPGTSERWDSCVHRRSWPVDPNASTAATSRGKRSGRRKASELFSSLSILDVLQHISCFKTW